MTPLETLRELVAGWRAFHRTKSMNPYEAFDTLCSRKMWSAWSAAEEIVNAAEASAEAKAVVPSPAPGAGAEPGMDQ